MSINWDGKDLMGGRRGQYGSYNEFMSKSQDQAKTILQNTQLFERMKPLLLKCLHMRVQNRTPIKIIQPIQNVTVDMAKGGMDSAGSARVGGQVIPSGIELVYDGFELGQMFFKSFRNGQEGPEYSVYTGENVVTGNQQVTRNTGLVGLLVKTDIFTTILELLGQNENK